MPTIFSRRARLSGLLLLTALAAGCGSKAPPPSDPAAIEKEVKQLNEHRQKEWNNE